MGLAKLWAQSSGGGPVCVCPMNGTTSYVTRGILLLCRVRLRFSVQQWVHWCQCLSAALRTLRTLSMILIPVKNFGITVGVFLFIYFRAPAEAKGRHQLGLSLLATACLLFGGWEDMPVYIIPFIRVSYFYKGKLLLKFEFCDAISLIITISFQYVLLQCKLSQICSILPPRKTT